MIAPHILGISGFLSIMWGIYLLHTIGEHQALRALKPTNSTRRMETVASFRRVAVAFCLWFLVFSYVFRTVCVLIGLGDAVAAQITFFALLGTNIPGSIFVVVSFWFD